MAPKSGNAKPKKGSSNKAPNKQTKPSSKPAPNHNQETFVASTQIPIELQQSVLNIFRSAFTDRLASDIRTLLQEVKQHLFNRDFLKAFGPKEYLEVYAVRWSPSRALGYLQIFSDISSFLRTKEDVYERDKTHPPPKWDILCLGGGAGAEIASLAGLQHLIYTKRLNEQNEEAPNLIETFPDNLRDNIPVFNVKTVDIADWSPVVHALHNSIATAPPVSKYTSTTARISNKALCTPEGFQVTPYQHDLLQLETSSLSDLAKDADLVTLMFTLNELYSTSVAQTQKLLLGLSNFMKPGSLLLVVDSPGSYSTVSLNGSEKRYPMQWLLDHTLMKLATEISEQATSSPIWQKVLIDESRWFRLPDGLKYPIELENMRFQIHLFRKSETSLD